MISSKNILLALSLSGMAVVTVLNLAADRSRRRERRQQRAELQRWESEGGNVYPVAGARLARRSGAGG